MEHTNAARGTIRSLGGKGQRVDYKMLMCEDGLEAEKQWALENDILL